MQLPRVCPYEGCQGTYLPCANNSVRNPFDPKSNRDAPGCLGVVRDLAYVTVAAGRYRCQAALSFRAK